MIANNSTESNEKYNTTDVTSTPSCTNQIKKQSSDRYLVIIAC